MIRPILSLWPYLCLLLLYVAMLGVLVCLPFRSVFTVAAVTVSLALCGWRWRWLVRFTRRVRRFCTVSNHQIVLHYAPELNGKWNVPELLQQCQTELNRLTERFGFSLRRRAVIFLFPNRQEIAQIFGPAYGGAALLFANVIVIPCDPYIQETMRHELAHLFSARWSAYAPPLLSEGLSVWMQDSSWGQPVDSAVRPMLGNHKLKLTLLLKPRFFFAEPQRYSCYIIAGSFTGFLIRRYGWQPYRKLFRLCDGIGFRPKFETCFGVSLEKAEWQWRNEIIVMEVLNRRLRRNVTF